jgi:putative MFS transporter
VTKLDSYQTRLLFFLGVASFFEGFDFMTFAQILPILKTEMHLTPLGGGLLQTIINAGTILAYFIVRYASTWGRKRVLTITVLGYAFFTFLTGFAPNMWVFGAAQCAARVFLIGEWATGLVIIAEEFPKERRGFGIATISATSGVGSIVCAITISLLTHTQFTWRLPFFVGVIPLLLVAWARRDLRETKRFVESSHIRHSIFTIFYSRHLNRVLQIGLIWFLTYVCTQNAVTNWRLFVTTERSISDGQAGFAIGLAAGLSVPAGYMIGPLLDILGRRGCAMIVFLATSLGVYGAYTFHSFWPLTVSLMIALMGTTTVLPVLNAWNAELFPTELRADAVAWGNNILGRIGYVLSPIAIGAWAGSVGSYELPMRVTTIFPLIALVLVLFLLPETRAKELEDTSRIA